MSVLFGNDWITSSTVASLSIPISMCCYVHILSFGSVQVLVSLGTTGDGADLDFHTVGSPNRLAMGEWTAMELQGTTTIATGTTYFLAGVFAEGTNNSEMFLSTLTGTLASEGTNTLTHEGPSNNVLRLGASTASSFQFDGIIRGFRCWEAAMTLADFEAERRSLHAVRLAGLVSQKPLLDVATSLHDRFGDWTLTSGELTNSSVQIPVPPLVQSMLPVGRVPLTSVFYTPMRSRR